MNGTCTYEAIKRYMSVGNGGECYVLVSKEMVKKGQTVAPNGIAWAELCKDFQALGGVADCADTTEVGIPVITSSSSAAGTPGALFSYTITATNAPTSFTADGLLPAGLTFKTTTGVISGTPTVARTSPITLGAKNPLATRTSILTLSPASPTPPS